MNLVMNKKDLLPVLQKAVKFVPRRSVMPVLDCFKLSADDNGLLISATNLEMAIIIPADAGISEPGETLVNAKLFLSIVSSMSNEIEFSCKDYKIKVSDEYGTSNLSALDPDEFPQIPLLPDKLFSIDSQNFARITRQAGVAASPEESRPVLTGLHYVTNGNEISVFGTDGFTMVETHGDILDASNDIDVIIPSQHAVTIASIFDNEDIEVFGNDATMVFTADGIVVSTQLIEGKYPDVSQIKPDENNMQSVSISKDALLSAISRIDVLGNEAHISRVSIVPNEFTIQSTNSEIGESEVSIDCDTDATIVIALNYVFLKKLAEQVGNEVIIKITDKTSPVVIRDKDTDDFYSVLMPMHLQEA